MWRNVKPASAPDAKTGAVTVALPSPLPAGKDQNERTVLYLFEDGPPQAPGANGALRGPQYLGEFSTAPVAGALQATLQPVLPLDQFERQRLAASRVPWIIYDTMPMDEHDIFAGMTDQQLKQLLPKQSVNDYLRDGKPATADDDPARVVGFDADGNACHRAISRRRPRKSTSAGFTITRWNSISWPTAVSRCWPKSTR